MQIGVFGVKSRITGLFGRFVHIFQPSCHQNCGKAGRLNGKKVCFYLEISPLEVDNGGELIVSPQFLLETKRGGLADGQKN